MCSVQSDEKHFELHVCMQRFCTNVVTINHSIFFSHTYKREKCEDKERFKMCTVAQRKGPDTACEKNLEPHWLKDKESKEQGTGIICCHDGSSALP